MNESDTQRLPDAAAQAAAPTPPPAPWPDVARDVHPGADDPFAGLPRITPFTDFPLDPVPSTPVQADDDSSGHRHRADDGGDDMLARILARERGR